MMSIQWLIGLCVYALGIGFHGYGMWREFKDARDAGAKEQAWKYAAATLVVLLWPVIAVVLMGRGYKEWYR